ncbi:MAG: SLC13 family permease [SAR324 cluster bacterium]|nr:SLC13 family permease [SAR324 cluster bacterium]
MWISLITLIVLILLIIGLIREVSTPAVLMFGAMLFFMVSGIVTTEEALAGFANSSMLTVAALFVVGAGLERTNALSVLSNGLFGRGKSLFVAMGRIFGIAGTSSVFMNNTTVVTVMVPAVLDWAKRRKFQASYFLLPLSYMAILGGTCSLIGTSTNLLIDGLMQNHQLQGMSLFELAWVGVPITMAGWFYLVLSSRYILKGQSDLVSRVMETQKQYICDVIVTAECKLVGKSIEDAGLRHLEGLFLTNIEREHEFIGPVSPREHLFAGDRLIFVGKVETLPQIQQIPGIVPAYQEFFNQEKQHSNLELFEVVLSYTSPLVDNNLRDVHFRSRYNAAVIAVHRPGTVIHAKLGDIIFRPGDVLMVQASKDFYTEWKYSTDFLLVAKADGKPEKPSRFTLMSLGIVAVLLIALTTGVLPVLHGSFLAAAAMIMSGCLSLNEAKEALFKEFGILVMIACAFGVGKAIESSGLAQMLASGIMELIGTPHPVLVLGIIMVLTALFTEFVTNNAAAAIMFPVGMASASVLNVDPRPFAIAIAVVASLAFITPFGYQTNLIVYGPGNYKMRDYLALGFPLKLLTLFIALGLIPWLWPFS